MLLRQSEILALSLISIIVIVELFRKYLILPAQMLLILLRLTRIPGNVLKQQKRHSVNLRILNSNLDMMQQGMLELFYSLMVIIHMAILMV